VAVEGFFLLVGIVVAIAILIQVVKASNRKKGTSGRSARGKGNAANRRQEALFVSTFPELQPHFHPEKVLQFVNGWRMRPAKADTAVWNDPPGFAPSRVRLMPTAEKGQPAELLDGAGAVLASFILQDHPEGGVIRVGSGKLTVNVQNAAVRYWHPQREFKWSRAKGWRVIHSLSDRPIESNDRGTSFASDGPSSSFSSSPSSSASAAAIAGAGGTFDGGGASAGWDDAGSSASTSDTSASDSSSDSSSSESRTSY
jgi:hypothetical protein